MKPFVFAWLGLAVSAAAQSGDLVTARSGRTTFPVSPRESVVVSWTEPFVLGVATQPEGWGFFQFPVLVRADDGELFSKWSMQADSIASYGGPSAPWKVSRDRGRTWSAISHERAGAAEGIALPDGDRLAIVTPKPVKVADLKLPAPVGTTIENYSRSPRDFYRLDQIPPASQGVYLKRLRRGAARWEAEHATLDDPGGLRYTMEGLLPIVWWGDLRIASDRSIFAGVYPGYHIEADGTANVRSDVPFFRSTDAGRSWTAVGRIRYEPDLAADPKGRDRAGFTEPAFVILQDGTFFCVLRTTDGLGHGPMYASRSRDRGATWSQPEVIAPAGVLPRLLSLDNGVVVLTSGRPGVQMRFSADGECRRWTPPLELLPYDGAKAVALNEVSCGYTGMVALGPDCLLLIYSDFNHPIAAGELRKAIKLREFIVAREPISP